MAKKSRERERERAETREFTMDAPDLPWEVTGPFGDPERTRAAPPDEEATGLLVFPPDEATQPLKLPKIPKVAQVAQAAEEATAPLVLPRPPPQASAGEEEAVPNRTLFSTKAVLLAYLLKDKFHRRMFGRAPYRVLRVDEPEGPSTAGGLLARQSISLVTQDNSLPSAPCGWVDTAKGEAQLRSYELITARYEARHGIPLNLSREQYDSFLNDLVEALMAGSIKVRVYIPEPGSAQESARPQARQRSRFGMVVALALAFALGMAAGRLVPWDAVLAGAWQLR
jgi:hypothetical protein